MIGKRPKMPAQDVIKAILGYFEIHRKALVTAQEAIEKGNASMAHEILKVVIRNIDVYTKKLEAIE